MKGSNLLLVLCCWCCVSCTAIDRGDTFESISEAFTASVADDWGDFSLCQYTDGTAEDAYLKLFTPSGMFSSGHDIQAQHFLLRQHSESAGYDLGIYRITFGFQDQAQQAFAEVFTPAPQGTIADGKILTRYAARLSGKEIYLLRSKTFFDPAVKSYFDAFVETR